MNRKRVFLISLALFQMITLLSQRVEFTYDESGNRLTRTIIVEQLRSESIKFPVLDSGSLKTAETVLEKGLEAGTTSRYRERISQTEGEIITVVYPNPNKGLVKIYISNMPSNSISEMRLYNLAGTELIVRKIFESNSEIDISEFKDGIYILRIKINESISDWKIIKSL
jgi:hypothetical protein